MGMLDGILGRQFHRATKITVVAAISLSRSTAGHLAWLGLDDRLPTWNAPVHPAHVGEHGLVEVNPPRRVRA